MGKRRGEKGSRGALPYTKHIDLRGGKGPRALKKSKGAFNLFFEATDDNTPDIYSWR